MIPYERQQKILSLLKDNEIVKFDKIQKVFPDVSSSTLRRDLKELEKRNKIQYLFGGAIKSISTIGEIPIKKRNMLYNEKKEKIAKLAANVIKDGDVIYLDSGSTCSTLFKEIINKKITIYTTNVDIFSIQNKFSAEVILLGGKFNFINSSISGSLTEENLSNIYFNKAFLGVNGIDEKYGVTTPSLDEASKKRIVKNHSDNVYLLCDSTKFHNLSNVKAFELDNVNVISDQNESKLGKKINIIFK